MPLAPDFFLFQGPPGLQVFGGLVQVGGQALHVRQILHQAVCHLQRIAFQLLI
jgi:hypothetical protein